MPRGRKLGSGKYSKNYRLRLSEEQKEKLKQMAAEQDKTEADILRDLIETAFNKS